MRIAFIGQKGIPASGGGVENYVDNLATRMSQSGHTVFAYTRSYYAPAGDYKGIQVIAQPSIRSKHLDTITHTIFSVFHALTLPGLEVVHINSAGPGLVMPLARALFMIKNLFTQHSTKLIFTFHSADWHHGKWNWVAKNMLRSGAFLGCRTAHEVITVSQSLQNYTQKAFGVHAHYIPNGVEVRIPESDHHLEQFNLTSGQYIVFVSRLIPHKNPHILIQAFQHMEDTYGKKLVIVGSGSHTEDYVDYLQTLAEDDSRVIFTGSQSGEPLYQLFAHAAAYVLPSSSEGLSISLLEAGAYGLPVVISDIPENTEIVQSYGYVAQVNDRESLTQQLELLFSDYETACEKGRLLQKRVEQEYSWSRIQENTETLYNTKLDRLLASVPHYS